MLTNVISGSGKLTKSGVGVLFLGGAVNTFSGSINVSGGTLALTNVNSTDGNTFPSGVSGISIGGNARVDVSGRSDGTLTLAGGQILSGGAGSNSVGAVIGDFGRQRRFALSRPAPAPRTPVRSPSPAMPCCTARPP